MLVSLVVMLVLAGLAVVLLGSSVGVGGIAVEVVDVDVDVVNADILIEMVVEVDVVIPEAENPIGSAMRTPSALSQHVMFKYSQQ